MNKYYDEAIKDITSSFWCYQYSIKYWSEDQKERRVCSGIVLAVSTDAAINQIKNYYIDDEDEILEIYVKEMDNGDLGSNLIIELGDAEDR